MFFRYESHEDALKAVAHVPPPATEEGSSVMLWDHDWVQDYAKSLKIRFPNPKVWWDISHEETEGRWDCEMSFVTRFESTLSRKHPRTNPERMLGQYVFDESGARIVDSFHDGMRMRKRPGQSNPLPWVGMNPHPFVLTQFNVRCQGQGQVFDTYTVELERKMMEAMDSDAATLSAARQGWRMLLDGVEAYVIRECSDLFSSSQGFWVRGIGANGAMFVDGVHLTDASLTEEDFSGEHTGLSLDILKGTVNFATSSREGFVAVVSFSDIPLPGQAPSDKPEVFVAFGETPEALLDDCAENFYPQMFTRCPLPPRGSGPRVKQALANYEHYQKQVEELHAAQAAISRQLQSL